MVDRKLVTTKLAELADRVARARVHTKESVAELAADRDALDLVSFNLMLAVQACVDIASHVIADEGWMAVRSFGTRPRALGVGIAYLAQPRTKQRLRRVSLGDVVVSGATVKRRAAPCDEAASDSAQQREPRSCTEGALEHDARIECHAYDQPDDTRREGKLSSDGPGRCARARSADRATKREPLRARARGPLVRRPPYLRDTPTPRSA